MFGKHNPEENSAAEILRVVKYDRNWNRVGAASITGDSEFGLDVGYIFHLGNQGSRFKLYWYIKKNEIIPSQ